MTLGDRIIKCEKMLKYLIEKPMYKEYLKSLDDLSGSGTTFFPTPNGWKEYKERSWKGINRK